jgi:hypothetical protein
VILRGSQSDELAHRLSAIGRVVYPVLLIVSYALLALVFLR